MRHLLLRLTWCVLGAFALGLWLIPELRKDWMGWSIACVASGLVVALVLGTINALLDDNPARLE